VLSSANARGAGLSSDGGTLDREGGRWGPHQLQKAADVEVPGVRSGSSTHCTSGREAKLGDGALARKGRWLRV
jgi:hypothetical protein